MIKFTAVQGCNFNEILISISQNGKYTLGIIQNRLFPLLMTHGKIQYQMKQSLKTT